MRVSEWVKKYVWKHFFPKLSPHAACDCCLCGDFVGWKSRSTTPQNGQIYYKSRTIVPQNSQIYYKSRSTMPQNSQIYYILKQVSSRIRCPQKYPRDTGYTWETMRWVGLLHVSLLCPLPLSSLFNSPLPLFLQSLVGCEICGEFSNFQKALEWCSRSPDSPHVCLILLLLPPMKGQLDFQLTTSLTQ